MYWNGGNAFSPTLEAWRNEALAEYTARSQLLPEEARTRQTKEAARVLEVNPAELGRAMDALSFSADEVFDIGGEFKLAWLMRFYNEERHRGTLEAKEGLGRLKVNTRKEPMPVSRHKIKGLMVKHGLLTVPMTVVFFVTHGFAGALGGSLGLAIILACAAVVGFKRRREVYIPQLKTTKVPVAAWLVDSIVLASVRYRHPDSARLRESAIITFNELVSVAAKGYHAAGNHDRSGYGTQASSYFDMEEQVLESLARTLGMVEALNDDLIKSDEWTQRQADKVSTASTELSSETNRLNELVKESETKLAARKQARKEIKDIMEGLQ